MNQLSQQQRTLADAALANKLNVIYHAYVDIAGDLIAGALLGQILYWFGAGKDGKSRARIVKDGFLWIAKTRADWWEEIRISPKQYDRAAKILKEKGFIEIRTFKFYGNPTTHIRIIPEAINAAIDAWKVEQVKTILPDGEEPAAPGFSPLGNNELPETENPLLPDGEQRDYPKGNNELPGSGISLTENVTENKKDNTAENTHTLAAAPPVSENAALATHKATMDQIAKDFETCWKEYPKKEGKQKARRAFEKAVRGIGARKANGEPYTAAEVLAEVILYRQYIEKRLAHGEMELRYVPTGGAWFEREGWTDETPSISSSFDDLLDGMDYNRNAAALRRCASMIDKAPADERPSLWDRLRQIRAALPY
jgi:hypothetical protein